MPSEANKLFLENEFGSVALIGNLRCCAIKVAKTGIQPKKAIVLKIQLVVPQWPMKWHQSNKYEATRDDRVLEDWITDAQRAVRGQPDGEAVDPMIFHLEGVAKEEVKLRPPSQWSSPSGVFQILRGIQRAAYRDPGQTEVLCQATGGP